MISGGLRASCRRAPAGASPRPEAGANDSAFTQKTYVHAIEEDLQRGQAALARIHKIAQGCEKR